MDFSAFSNILNDIEVVELSHPLQEGIPIWPTLSKYSHVECISMASNDSSTAFRLELSEHCGTHIDMPSHMMPEGRSAGEIESSRFCGECITLDFSHIEKCHTVSVEDIIRWENTHEHIKAHDIVLFNFGFSKKWGTYQNGLEFLSDWPGLSVEGARYLAGKEVKMVGVDCLSIDIMGTPDPIHHILLEKEILIIENIANLDKMPARGYFVALPLLIEEGSGSPVRAIGLKARKAANIRGN